MNAIPELPAMLDVEQLRLALRTVVDPEVGINIVDLGLVYGIEVTPGEVKITLTMTSPACPMSDLVIADVENAVRQRVSEEVQVNVDLVWNPPWDPSKMSDKARSTLGW
jgi:metal-sulfur cluster biosynthetic enzyme